MKKVIIDPGHAPGNVNKGPTGYYEYAGMWKLSNYLKKALERCGVEVKLTRSENEDPSLQNRGVYSKGTDVFISEHSNAANSQARGAECFYSVRNPNDKQWAAKISEAVSSLMNNPNRGAKTKESTTSKGYDYYGVIRAAVSVGTPHVFLVESGFHDNSVDEAFLKIDSNLEKIAEAQAKVLCELLEVEYIKPGSSIPTKLDDQQEQLTLIMGKTQATIEQMVSYALKGNANPKLPNCTIEELAQIFIEEAEVEGIRADGAWAQTLKETGYFKYGGIVLPEQNNYSGIGALNNNAQGDAAIFESPRIGARAQMQHLKAYGSTENLKLSCVDPRFHLVKRGSAKYFEWLGYKDNPNGAGWAWPGSGYGYDIIKMLNNILKEPKTETQENDSVPKWQREAFKKLVDNGVINTPEAWEDKLDKPITVGEVMGILANML